MERYLGRGRSGQEFVARIRKGNPAISDGQEAGRYKPSKAAVHLFKRRNRVLDPVGSRQKPGQRDDLPVKTHPSRE